MGSQHEGRTVIKSPDLVFDRLSNYRYYQHMSTSHVRVAEKSKKLQEQMKLFQVTIENSKASAEDQILVFDFLTMFVKEGDTLDVSEAHAFSIMFKLLKSQAKRHLRSIRIGAQFAGVRD